MSIEDSRKVADASNLHDFMLDYSDELEMAAASYNADEFRTYFTDRAAEAVRNSHNEALTEMRENPEYLKSVADLVSDGLYNDIRSEIQQRNIKYPCVYVNGSHNRNFSPEEVGFKVNYPYSVEEFNAALNQANEIWNNDEKYLDSLHSVSVSVYASRTESSTYNVELYASYHSIGEIIDEKQSIASANILGRLKDAISEIENKKPDEIPDDVDKFYVNHEMENVTWIRYNSDNDAGGQFVCTYMSFDDIFDAMEHNDPMEYLTENCGQEFLDRGAEGFDGVAEEFMTDSEDISSHDSDCLSKLFALTEPRYAIYQLKDDEKLRDYHFTNSEHLKKHGMYIDRENYDRVYRGRLQENETLDDIYKRFNVDHPQDFRGHSLSVGDIVAVKKNGTIRAYFVDSFGFTVVPDFTLSREERKARRALTDNIGLLAEKQLASDEMDDLGDKLFNYDHAPVYSSITNWTMGASLSADEFEDLTTRFHNGEDISTELAKRIYANMRYLNFEYPPADGISRVEISSEKTDSGMIFRTNGGFEVSYTWETLGNALITAAKQEFDRHEQLDREYFLKEAKARINEYSQREFREDANFSELSRVPLAYTTHEDTEVGISVYADLENKKIVTMYGDKVAEEKNFRFSDDMISALGNLEFSDLVSITDETVQRLTEPQNDTLSNSSTEGVQLNLFGEPAENSAPRKQTAITTADTNSPLITQDMFDCVLRCGSNEPRSLERIISQYQLNKGAESNAEYLRNEFGTDARGIDFGQSTGAADRRITAWYDENGITIGLGDTALNSPAQKTITWEQAAERIEELLGDGKFADQVTIDDAEAYTRRKLAEKLWYLNRDVEGDFFIPDEFFIGGFPESTERISEALKGEKPVSEFIAGMTDLIKRCETDKDVLRFPHRNLHEILENLKDLQLERREFRTEKNFEFSPVMFISEEEKDLLILSGSGVQGGKFRNGHEPMLGREQRTHPVAVVSDDGDVVIVPHPVGARGALDQLEEQPVGHFRDGFGFRDAATAEDELFGHRPRTVDHQHESRAVQAGYGLAVHALSESSDRVIIVLHLLFVVGIQSVADGHIERAVAAAVLLGGLAKRTAGIRARSDRVGELPIGGGVAQNGPEYPVGPVASVIVVPLRKGRETGGYRIERGDPAGIHVVEQRDNGPFDDELSADVEPAARTVGASRRAAFEHRPERSDNGLVVELETPPEHGRRDRHFLIIIAVGIGIGVGERIERIDRTHHRAANIGIVLLEADRVATQGAPVAHRPLFDIAHRSVAGQVGPRQQAGAAVVLDQIGVRELRGVVVVGVVPQHHGKGPLQGGRHDVGAAAELAAPQVHRLVDGAALEEVVALVGAAAGIEKREHPCDQQRGLMVRNGIGPGENRGGLAAFAMAVGEKKRMGGGEALVQHRALPHEATFQDGAVVHAGPFGQDEIPRLNIRTDESPGAKRAVFEQRGAIDCRPVADPHLPHEAGALHTGPAPYRSQLRGTFEDICADHPLQCGDRLRPMAVHGQQVGDLRGERVVNPHGAAGTFVHGSHLRAVSERRAAAAFERRHALHERLVAQQVVAHGGVVNPCPPTDPHPPLETARAALRGRKIGGHLHFAPVGGGIGGPLEGCDLRVG